jgi:hypothetical protein
MGKQIQFHALREDMIAFLECVQQQQGPIVVTLKSSDSPTVTAVPNPSVESQTMTLWNKALLGALQRKLVVRAVGGNYYRVDDSLPTLELSPSRVVQWNGRPALLQGRVYGFFDRPFSGYGEWYEFVARCIRKKFKKNPFKLLGGYVGPEALKWFQDGGTLLPMFEPPPTPEWISFVENQHPMSSTVNE